MIAFSSSLTTFDVLLPTSVGMTLIYFTSVDRAVSFVFSAEPSTLVAHLHASCRPAWVRLEPSSCVDRFLFGPEISSMVQTASFTSVSSATCKRRSENFGPGKNHTTWASMNCMNVQHSIHACQAAAFWKTSTRHTCAFYRIVAKGSDWIYKAY